LGRGITAADVVLATGSSPTVVQKDLLTFAHVVRARMKVLSDGEFVYEIPAGYKGTLLQRSISFRVFTICRRLWPYAFSAVKCAFGAMLFASLAVPCFLLHWQSLARLSPVAAREVKWSKRSKRRRGRGGFTGVAASTAQQE
jgi:hypothetical protein